jgi:alanine dehydrogenase
MDQSASTLYSNEQNLMDLLPKVDLLIGAVLLPGSKAPKLIREEMLDLMAPGSVFVDIAIDQGGCAETSRATTHDDPVYTEHGVVHYCVANMPGAYPRTATQALTNATLPYAIKIANLGYHEALSQMEDLQGGLNTYQGKLTYKAVADALNLPFHESPFSSKMNCQESALC